MDSKRVSGKYIVFTGGGSAGHVTPNIAVIQKCINAGWKVAYIGTDKGIEKTIVSKLLIPFYGISSGKLRRYFSWHNFIDPFKILFAIAQSYFLLKKIKPALVFSKGGFVAFPVVFAAWLNRIPIVAHESDFTLGLANRLCLPFVSKICITFAEGKEIFKQQDKVVVTGAPLREALFSGIPQRGKAYCGFRDEKPILMITGGGSGSVLINQTVRAILPELLTDFNVIHICGEDKTSMDYDNIAGYQQFTYVNDEWPDLMAAADLVISRSGSNSVYELLALKKPHIFIPLSKHASRGDQIDNANFCAERGLSYVLKEALLNQKSLLAAIHTVHKQRAQITQKLQDFSVQSGTGAIFAVFLSVLGISSPRHCEE